MSRTTHFWPEDPRLYGPSVCPDCGAPVLGFHLCDSLVESPAPTRSRDERAKGPVPATARDVEPGPRERQR